MKHIYKLFTNARFRKTMRMLVRIVWQQWLFSKKKRFLSPEKAEQRSKDLMRKHTQLYTKRAVELGGLLIKLGQHISARVDIMPREVIDELIGLQDNVAPADSAIIVATIEAELGKPIHQLFATFDHQPLAAASLGQVHVATLPNGEKVAVKVLRPEIEKILETDLESLRIALSFLDKKTNFGKYADLPRLYEEFYNTLMDELDFRKEGENAERIAQQFINDDWIIIPKIYWNYATSKVLTMDFLEGIKINEFEQISKLGINREELALNFFEVYMQQVLVYGFYHADPHPGNVLVQKDGRIALLDFGMVGSISQEMKEQIIHLLISVYLKDANGAIDALLNLGFIRQGVDLEKFSKSLEVLLGQLLGEKTNYNKHDNVAVFDELSDFLLEHPFQLPAKTIFLGKALGTIASICSVLHPKFDIVNTARPYVEDIMKDELIGNTLRNLWDQGTKIVKDIIPTSKKAIHVINKMEAGNLRVKIAGNLEDKIIRAGHQNTNRIVSTIIGAVIFYAGSQLATTPAHEKYAHIVMGVGMMVMVWQLRRRTSKRKIRRAEMKRERAINALKAEAEMNPIVKIKV